MNAWIHIGPLLPYVLFIRPFCFASSFSNFSFQDFRAWTSYIRMPEPDRTSLPRYHSGYWYWQLLSVCMWIDMEHVRLIRRSFGPLACLILKIGKLAETAGVWCTVFCHCRCSWKCKVHIVTYFYFKANDSITDASTITSFGNRHVAPFTRVEPRICLMCVAQAFEIVFGLITRL